IRTISSTPAPSTCLATAVPQTTSCTCCVARSAAGKASKSDSSRAERGPATMRAIVVEEFGAAENMKVADLAKPAPGPGEAIVKVAFSGVNFIDVYYRIGLYKVPLPASIGNEAAGIVDAVGEGVSDLRPGDRVAYAMARGSYAEFAKVPAAQLVKVPDTVSLEQAAAVMLQGMTAHYLTRTTFP